MYMPLHTVFWIKIDASLLNIPRHLNLIEIELLETGKSHSQG